MILIVVIAFVVAGWLVWREYEKMQRCWFYRYPWWMQDIIVKDRVWHRCGICQHWMSDCSSLFQDYTCPTGHYEFHFDCGQFKCRVGEQWFEFWDDPAEKQAGLAKIKTACNLNISRRLHVHD